MRTTVTGDVIDLQFDPATKESTLTHALALKQAVAEAVPLPRPGELLGDTRILRSEVIHLYMRPGGREIDKVETDGLGTVDFLPKIKVEVVLADNVTAAAVEAIVKAAKTGKIGDGKVFVSSIENAVRIRTEETGEQAV